MVHRAQWAVITIAVFASACASAPAPSPTVAPARAAPPAPSATVAAEAPDPLDEKHRYCPLTVETAKTEVRDVEGGIELVVHVADAAQAAELEKRVRHLEEFTQKDGKVGGRHGTGKGGGRMRTCPVVTQKTHIEGDRIELGFRIVVRSNDPSDLDAMRAETRKRFAELTPSKPANP